MQRSAVAEVGRLVAARPALGARLIDAALGDDDPSIRCMAVAELHTLASLADFDGEQVAPLFERALADAEPLVRARAYAALAGLAKTAPAIATVMGAGKVARDARAAPVPTGSAAPEAGSSDPVPPTWAPDSLGDWREGEPLEYFGTLHAGFTEETWLVWGYPSSERDVPPSGYACSFDECLGALHWLRGPVAAAREPLREVTGDLDDYIDYDDPEVRAWTDWLDDLIAVARERGAPPGESLLDDWITINVWTIMRVESLRHYVHSRGDADWWREKYWPETVADEDDEDPPTDESPLEADAAGRVQLTPAFLRWLERTLLEAFE